MTDPTAASERRAKGLAMFHEVYGDNVTPPAGTATFFDLLIIDQQFAEVWSRPALSIPSRRLLVMGVLAASGRFDILVTQFHRALETGELTAEQVREVVIHLIPYVGTPSSGDLFQAGEKAIATHGETAGSAGSAGEQSPGEIAHGQLEYLQIPSADPMRSAAFYQQVFGWRSDPGSASFEAPGLIGQWVDDRPAVLDAGPLLWIRVDDIEHALSLVTAHGGEVLDDPSPDGPTRLLATVRDPGGTAVGLVQSAPA